MTTRRGREGKEKSAWGHSVAILNMCACECCFCFGVVGNCRCFEVWMCPLARGGVTGGDEEEEEEEEEREMGRWVNLQFQHFVTPS